MVRESGDKYQNKGGNMKRIKQLLWILMMLICIEMQAQSHLKDRAGISFQCSYWHQRGSDEVYSVHSARLFQNEVNVGGYGGWLTFFSGAGENGMIVVKLGGIAHVEVVEEDLFDEAVDVKAVVPVLIGYQHFLMQNGNTSSFQPYISAGGGPYIITHVNSRQYALLDDEVTVESRVKPGGYFGLGGFFIFTEWLAFQGEMRYHLVNFYPENEFSGFEVALGLALSWKR
jgi:hypothetical protein